MMRALRSSNELLPPPDLFIAATAMVHKLPLATLNIKHFERVSGLVLLDRV
jgi:predicted nucleic acid-binding protein